MDVILSNAMLSNPQLDAVAEDIEYFQNWAQHSEGIDNAEIRRGSAALRRLLVEDAAGIAWRQMGFEKSPSLPGPDLLGFFRKVGIEIDLVSIAAAAGVRFAGIDTALFAARRVDNPATGVSARANEGFAVSVSNVSRNADNPQPSDLDIFIERTWRLQEYLDAPGVVRKGETISRREVLKHMANEMGGVHVGQNFSEMREVLNDAESRLLIDSRQGELRTHYIEVLAMGQAVGRSEDFRKLAAAIRSH